MSVISLSVMKAYEAPEKVVPEKKNPSQRVSRATIVHCFLTEIDTNDYRVVFIGKRGSHESSK